MSDGFDISTAWGRAVLAQRLYAVDPAGLGGVLVSARPGPVLDRWLADLKATLAGLTWRKLPQGIDDARLLGGLDLAATLATVAPVAERGLLADAHGGILQAGNVELLDAGRWRDWRLCSIRSSGRATRRPFHFGRCTFRVDCNLSASRDGARFRSTIRPARIPDRSQRSFDAGGDGSSASGRGALRRTSTAFMRDSD